MLIVKRSKYKLSRGSQRCKDLTGDQKQIAVKQKHQGRSAESCEPPKTARRVCRARPSGACVAWLGSLLLKLCFPWGAGEGEGVEGEPGKEGGQD